MEKMICKGMEWSFFKCFAADPASDTRLKTFQGLKFNYFKRLLKKSLLPEIKINLIELVITHKTQVFWT